MSRVSELEKAAETTLEKGFAVIHKFFSDTEAAQIKHELETHEDFKVDINEKINNGQTPDIFLHPLFTPLLLETIEAVDEASISTTGNPINSLSNRMYDLVGKPQTAVHIDRTFKTGFNTGLRSAHMKMRIWDSQLKPHYLELDEASLYMMRLAHKHDPEDPMGVEIHLRDETTDPCWDEIREFSGGCKTTDKLFVPEDGRVWHAVDAILRPTVSLLIGHDSSYSD